MNKMNKKILSLAVMLPMFLCSFAQDDVTKEKFTPFYHNVIDEAIRLA